MKLKTIQDENFTDYKKCSMLICAHTCNFKCGKENCHNKEIINMPTLEIPNEKIIQRYLTNKLTSAIIISGMEPFDDFEDLKKFIIDFRNGCNDDIVIFTGYNKNEILKEIGILKQFPNIIIKYGRYISGQQKHFDAILGVQLASPNQYAEALS